MLHGKQSGAGDRSREKEKMKKLHEVTFYVSSDEVLDNRPKENYSTRWRAIK